MPRRLFGEKCSSAALIFVILAMSLLETSQAYAQVAGATLTGTVKDPSGSFIPDAQVSITDVATSVTRSVSSNGAGLYIAPNLLPATYEVRISAMGFRTSVQKGITLTVGAQQVLDFTMQVGQTALDIMDRFHTAALGRFHSIGWMDWSGVERKDFAQVTIERLKRMREHGAVGIKFWKDLGLTLKNPDGSLLRIDEERFAPIFEACGEMNFPVMFNVWMLSASMGARVTRDTSPSKSMASTAFSFLLSV